MSKHYPKPTLIIWVFLSCFGLSYVFGQINKSRSIDIPKPASTAIRRPTKIVEMPNPTPRSTGNSGSIDNETTNDSKQECVAGSVFLEDVPISDGNQVPPGSALVKTWRMRNSGTCVWDSSHALVFVKGDQLGPRSTQLPAAVPGEEADIWLEVEAPTKPGAYEGTWELRDANNQPFGFVILAINVRGTSSSSTTALWSPSAANGRLAFVSKRDGNNEIYLMNPDGSALINLTNNPAFDWEPAWSPGGTRIAFGSNRNNNPEVYVMKADGGGLINLTSNPTGDWGAAWSPDGTRIAFYSNRDGNNDIYVMNANGSGWINLTNNASQEWGATWSPDGTRIAFVSERDGNRDIYVMNADGSQLKRLTNNLAVDDAPAWSPNGRIAFQSKRDGNYEIYLMNADGTQLENLTNNSAHDLDPAWLSAETIAFASKRDGNYEIYLMNADGSGLKRLTNSPGDDRWPAWSPLSTLSTTAVSPQPSATSSNSHETGAEGQTSSGSSSNCSTSSLCEIDITLNLKGYDWINLRDLDRSDFREIGRVDYGTSNLKAIGRTQDSTWIQLRLANGQTGWLLSDYISNYNELNNLPLATPRYLPEIEAYIELKGYPSIYVQAEPNSNADYVAQIYSPRESFTATGLNRDAQWVYVRLANGQKGWISREFVVSESSLDVLPRREPN